MQERSETERRATTTITGPVLTKADQESCKQCSEINLLRRFNLGDFKLQCFDMKANFQSTFVLDVSRRNQCLICCRGYSPQFVF